jgi:hypothetical protein
VEARSFCPIQVLLGFDVTDVIQQMATCKRAPEVVKERIWAVRPFRALVGKLRDALAAIQFPVESDALEFEFAPFVWPARLVWKNHGIRVELFLTLYISEAPRSTAQAPEPRALLCS